MAEIPRIKLASRAVRDLRKMEGPERRRIQAALHELRDGAENLDIKALTGSAPWLRLRVGEQRVLYRPLSTSEAVEGGVLVARIINRRELDRAVRTLNG